MTNNNFKKIFAYAPVHTMSRCLFFIVVFVSFLGIDAQAQLKVYPLPRHVGANQKIKSKAGRTKADPLVLPFWDDFSFTPVNDTTDTLSNVPLQSLWENGWKVWVNDGIGINPPSRNVATFDGLDSLGRAYSEQQLANGFRDILTSHPIDLSVTGGIAEGDRTSVYLSFFYQLQGNGEPPDASDYMRVEFKDSTGTWITALTINTKANFDKNVFYDTTVQVNGDQFFHADFQFRFKNYGRLSGPYDTWNIDYVYMNKNRNEFDRYFPDATLSSAVGPIFNQYYSIPLRHFRESKTISPATVNVFNVRSYIASYNYRAYGNFKNYVNGTLESHDETLVFSRGVGTNPNGSASGIVNPFETKQIILYKSPNPDDPLQFNPAADSIDIKLSFKLVSSDVVDTLGVADPNYAPYSPVEFRVNDTLSATYQLRKYYAYDDGGAEYSAALTEAGNRGAYRFEMLSAAPDTLIGFDIYFPGFSLTSGVTTDFYVYGDLDGTPGTLLYILPSRPVKAEGSNVFTRFEIIEPFLVRDKFYIGWKAPIGAPLQIGLDLSHDTGDRIYVNTNGNWFQNTDVKGSLMIRPRFGKGDIVTGISETAKTHRVYPNPNSGEFYLQGEIEALEIISVTGTPIAYTKEILEDESKITLRNAAPGLYLLKIRRREGLSTQKIIVK